MVRAMRRADGPGRRVTLVATELSVRRLEYPPQRPMYGSVRPCQHSLFVLASPKPNDPNGESETS